MPPTKCKYWDKCFRNSEMHREQFLHPVDEDEEEDTGKAEGVKKKAAEAPKEKMGGASAVSKTPKKLVKMGGAPKAEEDDMDTTPVKDVKALKRKTHAMSQSDGEDEEDEPVAASPSKKAKSEDKDDEEAGPSVVKKVRLRCKYWDECYQTGQSHLKQYIHPGDYDAPEEDVEKKKTRGKTKTPLNEMKDGEAIDVDSARIKRSGDIYECTCPMWQKQKHDEEYRTCKHLQEYLGEEFENSRTDKPAKKKKAYIPQHISVSVLLAQKYDPKATNPVGWWMSEKLDGVRAFWNGRCFYSRLGNAFIAPEWFTKDLPTDMHLDGELFGGRGKFQSTVSIVKTPGDERWKKISYHVFDVPSLEKQPFEKRYEELQGYFDKAKPKYAVLCEQTKCTSKEHVEEELEKAIDLGGEGVMLREPKSKYERRRSPSLLKMKKFHDAEAVVIGHEKGKGRNQFVCGALRCRMECGKEFSVGSGLNDAQRRKPPKIGAIITYRFQEYTNSGSPRFPTFVGIRIDADGPKDVILPDKPSDD
ncbi:LOW QUALITY PROTEIN: uncharacterized protein LOC124259371 [Haliotis rubra]|uniref:LOW QUALITY PROTEIN: uncharacterized protein LOC124259371 n=1 Tax=Haliotis rubra TaxID=36100 RepID=UPI001EE58CFF|nr:LOW QUALITY PROTEIN: uncharacterized protein LOC124259371 [Haliotis rubra]